MASAPPAPADTTMMRIVHDALRRDLARATATLAEPGTACDQRRAVGSHLLWLMQFLHAHHASEDEGLYPVVRERAPASADVLDVLDRMAEQHERIATAIATVEGTAAALVADGSLDASREVVAALEALAAALLPHLQEEEDRAMPLTSQLITAEEWQSIEQRHNLEGKTPSQLGFEGHWLIDGATAADRGRVTGLVPPIQRLILLRGFARRYRRHVRACWGQAEPPPRRVQLDNCVTVTVGAGVEEVWDVVRDVTRVGEWSHECVGASWLEGSTSATPGARFRGRNRAGIFRWGRVCEIVSADPHELVWKTVPSFRYPDSSEWRISLEEVGQGTKITQRFGVLHAPKVLMVLYAMLIPAHRDRTASLIGDLERLGAVALASRTP
jgi:iron-sulfur cluster repair protein YtfE (RIC family)